jgi:FkbM family methyltransferase
VFDVGAKYGAFTAQYLRIFPNAHIWAFDCAPKAIERLHQEFDGNERVEVVPLALLDRPGEITFHLCERAGSNSVHPITDTFAQETRNTGTIIVQATTLDLFCEQRGIREIDLLKTDVEGADLQVLGGASLLWEKRVHNLFVELLYYPYYQGQHWHWEVCKFLDGVGYSLWAMWPTYWGGRLRYANALFVRD